MRRILPQIHKAPFSKIQTGVDLSCLLGISLQTLQYLVRTRSKHYFEDFEPKPDGEMRTLNKPSGELKEVQRKILRLILERVPLKPCVYGLQKEKGIVENALIHLDQPYLANFDVKKYFPSIHISMVKRLFLELGFGKEALSILTQLTTNNFELPQGAPSSNYIAGLMLTRADMMFSALARKHGCRYTRYFDDISISGKQDLKVFEREVGRIVSINGFRLNKKKTVFFNPGEEKTVTGITISNGKICAPKAEEEVARHLERIESGTVVIGENATREKRILGLISFINQVDGKLSANMMKRYKASLTKFH